MGIKIFDIVSAVATPIICWCIGIKLGWIAGWGFFGIFSLFYIACKIQDRDA